ncbi:ROK family protein, partial [Salmonella enterica subsp. enterica serovar Montevideo]|nr:ROK family protein [Salmonella enterica subsp. enterica serovar Montevideo]
VKSYIKTIGLFNSKAENVIKTCRILLDKHNGEVPEDRAALEAQLSRYELRLAKALSHVVNILDPDVIVLGGGMSNVERLYKTVPS